MISAKPYAAPYLSEDYKFLVLSTVKSQSIISWEFSNPNPLDKLPSAFAADALISGIESNKEFLIAGIKILIYGSRSSGS